MAESTNALFKDAESSTQAYTFRFLDLPAEIRNEMYELALTYDEDSTNFTVHDRGDFAGYSNAVKGACKQPALTRVSRTVRRETLPIFYGENIFKVNVIGLPSHLSLILLWLNSMEAPHRKMLLKLWAWCRKDDMENYDGSYLVRRFGSKYDMKIKLEGFELCQPCPGDAESGTESLVSGDEVAASIDEGYGWTKDEYGWTRVTFTDFEEPDYYWI